MDIAGSIVFVSALLLASGTPGPGIAAIVARVLGRGIGGAAPLAFGLACGDLVWLTTGVWGLAALQKNFMPVFLAIKWGGIAYLFYLAWRMWIASVVERDVEADMRAESPGALWLTGFSVALGNPKVMAFYWALMPTIVDLSKVNVTIWLQLVVLTLASLTITFGGYITLASQARKLFKQADTVRVVNRLAAIAIAGTAVWMAAR